MQNENLKKYLIYIGVALLIFGAGFLLGRNTATTNTAGLDPIRADIQRVIQQQQDIIAVQHTISAGLDKSVKGIGAVEARIAGIEGVVGEVAGRVDSDRARLNEQQRLIDEGQSIVGGRK